MAIERALLTLPEVTSVVSKLGRPDLATEAMGTYESDTYVGLREPERMAARRKGRASRRNGQRARATFPA